MDSLSSNYHFMYKKILFFLCFSQLAWASFSQNLPPGAASYANEGNEPLEFRTGMPNTKGSSPNVSAFRRIEDAGVDMFNGISTLKLPLYRLSGEQMQFDVGLSYYGGGVRMNEIAGWTGLSWTLDGEYQISRIVNDLPDEWYNTASSSYMSGAYRDKGYLYTAKQQLDHNNWTSPGFLGLESFDIHLLSNVATMDKFIFDSEPDEFRFALPNGVSGSFYRDHRANPNDLNGWKVKSKSNLVLEITHELHVVEYNTNNLYEIELDKWSGGSTCKIPTLFTKFIIGTPDGYRYVFGGVETALEVSRGILKFPNPSDPKIKTEAQYTVNSWKLSKIIAPSGEEVNFAYSRDKIQFQRSKELINAVKQGTNQWSTPSLEVNASITYPVYLSVIETKKQKLIFKRSQAIEKWYLALVDSGCNMSTLGPSANNNNFSFLVLRDDQQHCQYAYNYLWDSQNNFEGNLPNYNQQLDSVILFDKLSNQYVDGFKLVQRANPNHRRTLDRIFKFNFTDSKIQDNYEFTYNNIEGLPNLEAWNRDYWGFEQDGNAEPVTGCGILYELRSTTGNFAIKGLLNTIKNPLGGITEIQYEANVYSKQIKVNTTNGSVNVANNVNGNAVGPGARVKKIIQKDYLGAPDTYKEYFYTSNYPVGTNSSGLLNFDNIAIDAITGNCGNSSSTLANYSTLNQNQFTKQFKGGIINYSEVTERNADGSYTVFNYTNAENPEYRDEFAAGYGSYNVLNSSNLNFRLSSKDLDRGKMKTIRQYSSNNRLVKKTENIYQDDPLRVSDYIKSISILTLGSISSYYCLGQAEPGLGNHRAWAYKNYTYKNPLIKSIQTDYFESGPDIVSETEYGYDPYGNIASTKSKDSDGNTIVKTTKYNSHPDYDMVTSNNTASGIRKLKYQYGIKNFPVETMFSSQKPPVSGVDQPPYYLSAQLNTVNINRPMPEKKYLLRAANGLIEGTPSNTNGFFSSKISTSGTFQMDSRYVLEEEIIDFTTGNALALPKPVSVTNRQGGNYTLTWDHSGFYASSKTANVTVAEIAYSGFDGTYSGNNAVFKNGWNFNEANVQTGISFTGQRSLQAVPVSSGTAANAFITTGNVIIGKPYKISFWARSVIGNLYLANGTSATVLSLKKTGKDGWQYYEAEFIPNGTVGLVYASSGIIPINAQIDELMLLPMNAQMESYSYNTGTGNITSVNTGNGNVLLYEYDGLGRLLTVRDDAGNILKNHSYKLQNN
ncbi:MAG: hypothetical protein BGO31_07500 [Bacteroidetes bacterium 43-16]|nr:MAG: hypothetical protein BGO31_07500 [Bacteroidetes bacterium 43-16]